MADDTTNQDGDLFGSVDDLLNQLEDMRQDELHNLTQFQAARQALLGLEVQRLSTKLSADHPRVQKLQAQRISNARVINGLETQYEVASVKPPEIGQDEALIEGRITDEYRRGMANLKVTLEDEQGNPIKVAGTVKTTAAGYYALKLDPEVLQQIPDAYLTIRAPNGAIVHREQPALRVDKGQRAAWNVALKRHRPGPTAASPRPEPQPDAGRKGWRIHGRVLDKRGRGVAGLTVTLHVKVRRTSDKLGADVTDKEGRYATAYQPQEGVEGPRPGTRLFLTVTDKEGNVLHTTQEKLVYEDGQEKELDIRIV